MNEVEGTVQGHRDGHGFVVPDDASLGGNIYLPPEEMRTVLHRDRVKVRVVRHDRKGRPEGRVLEILERRRTPIIGRLLQEGGQWLVAPEDRRTGQDILVPRQGIGAAQVGQVVAVELTEVPSLHSQPVGRVVEVLGAIDDPGMEIEIAVRKFDVPHRFSAETLAQAEALPDRLRPVDRRRRVDLSDVPLVTIDGEDARDFDDAVYAQPREAEDGPGWRLLVAIADVSHYVRPGMALDDDAFRRSTSVYFPRRVIPMLPEKLSNGLCSLNPQQDRLSLVCDMVVTPAGEVEAYQFYPAVICSHARLTYTEVAAILGNTRGPEARRRDEDVPGLVGHLVHLHEAYRALQQARSRRGAVDFETTETRIVCDAQGRIESIEPRTRNEAHRLIEEAMLAANVCAADLIERSGHPALFRVHEGPTPEKRQTLLNYLRSVGLPPQLCALSESPKPSELQAIAQATRERPDAAQIHAMLLRSMQQAIYTPTNSGHFGLAYGAYTHFTSPIRRYPDLLVHRVIKALLTGKRYRLEMVADEASVGAVRKLDEADAWAAAGAHTSAAERRADEASRDVEAWLKCQFMRERLGDDFAGTVTAATPFGLFVQLDALYVEGMIHISELGRDYFRFDEVRQELRGEHTGIRYAIGSRLRVQVSRVDLDARRIDFRPIPSELPARERRLSPGRVDPADKEGGAEAALKSVREADRQLRRQSRNLKEGGAPAKPGRSARAAPTRKTSKKGRA
jgi:ribonuclease R